MAISKSPHTTLIVAIEGAIRIAVIVSSGQIIQRRAELELLFVLHSVQRWDWVRWHLPPNRHRPAQLLALAPEAKRILVIGWGSGQTAAEFLSSPVEKVTAVEISPEVVEAAPWFAAVNARALSGSASPRPCGAQGSPSRLAFRPALAKAAAP